MCTNIVVKTELAGWGKGNEGWFDLNKLSIAYDHPYHAPLEYAISLDFLNESAGPSARVAVELTPDSAKALILALQAALDRGEAEGVKP